jgi:hypothetical protein
MRLVTSGPLAGDFAPTLHGIVNTDDRIEAILNLHSSHPSSIAAHNVSVTLIPPTGSGITVLNNPVQFGTVAGSGASSTGVFEIQTSGTQPGNYKLDMIIQYEGGTQRSTLCVPVWHVGTTVLDLANGQVQGDVQTPFVHDAIAFTAPEVLSGGEPLYFNLQSIDDIRTFEVPFHGAHWGDPLPPVPTRTSLLMPIQTFSLVGSVHTTSGDPLGGYGVTLTRNGAMYQATSGQDGVYRFSGLLPGSYTRAISPPVSGAGYYSPGQATNAFVFSAGAWTDGVGWQYPPVPVQAIEEG